MSPGPIYTPDSWTVNTAVEPRVQLPVLTKAQTTVRSSAGLAVTSTDGLRGFATVESTSTQWRLAGLGTTSTLESTLGLTLVGSASAAFASTAGTTPDVKESRFSTTTPGASSIDIFTLALLPNSTAMIEIAFACKSANGQLWGQFRRVGTFQRFASAPCVLVGQTAISVGYSHAFWDASLIAGGSANTAIVRVSSIDGTPLSWVGTIRRTVLV